MRIRKKKWIFFRNCEKIEQEIMIFFEDNFAMLGPVCVYARERGKKEYERITIRIIINGLHEVDNKELNEKEKERPFLFIISRKHWYCHMT